MRCCVLKFKAGCSSLKFTESMPFLAGHTQIWKIAGFKRKSKFNNSLYNEIDHSPKLRSEAVAQHYILNRNSACDVLGVLASVC